MNFSRVTALIAALALAFSLASPPRAEALSDGGEIALWVIGGITAFVAGVMLGTYLTRDPRKMFLVEPPVDEDAEKPAIVVGFECRQPDGTPALICW